MYYNIRMYDCYIIYIIYSRVYFPEGYLLNSKGGGISDNYRNGKNSQCIAP